MRLLVPLDGAQRRRDERFYVRVPLLPTVGGRDVVHDPQRFEVGAKALGPPVPAVLLYVDLDDRVLRELASSSRSRKGTGKRRTCRGGPWPSRMPATQLVSRYLADSSGYVLTVIIIRARCRAPPIAPPLPVRPRSIGGEAFASGKSAYGLDG